MILGYAWSNFTVLNLVNVKLTYFSNEPFDLLIRSNKTLSNTLLEEVEKQKIFSNIYYIPMPQIDKRLGIIGKIPKLRFWSYKRNYKNSMERSLDNTIKDQVYDLCITAGFWADTLYVIDHIFKRNRNLKIQLFEEGERSYEEFSSLTVSDTHHSLKEKLISSYMHGKYRRKYLYYLSRELYLYNPSIYEEEKITTKVLPSLTDSNTCCLKILQRSTHLEESHILQYIKKKYIYLAGYIVKGYEDNYGQSYHIINTLMETVGSNNVIIKTHSNSIDHRLHFAEQWNSRVFIDREVYIFEALCSTIALENKVIISRGSSVAMNVKALFNMEPYVILTYRLYPYYHQYGEDTLDGYVERLRKLYTNKEKIFVPNSELEMIEILKALNEKFTSYPYKSTNSR